MTPLDSLALIRAILEAADALRKIGEDVTPATVVMELESCGRDREVEALGFGALVKR